MEYENLVQRSLNAENDLDRAKLAAIILRSGCYEPSDKVFSKAFSNCFKRGDKKAVRKHFIDFIKKDETLAMEIWYGKNCPFSMKSDKDIFEACGEALHEDLAKRKQREGTSR